MKICGFKRKDRWVLLRMESNNFLTIEDEIYRSNTQRKWELNNPKGLLQNNFFSGFNCRTFTGQFCNRNHNFSSFLWRYKQNSYNLIHKHINACLYISIYRYMYCVWISVKNLCVSELRNGGGIYVCGSTMEVKSKGILGAE